MIQGGKCRDGGRGGASEGTSGIRRFAVSGLFVLLLLLATYATLRAAGSAPQQTPDEAASPVRGGAASLAGGQGQGSGTVSASTATPVPRGASTSPDGEGADARLPVPPRGSGAAGMAPPDTTGTPDVAGVSDANGVLASPDSTGTKGAPNVPDADEGDGALAQSRPGSVDGMSGQRNVAAAAEPLRHVSPSDMRGRQDAPAPPRADVAPGIPGVSGTPVPGERQTRGNADAGRHDDGEERATDTGDASPEPPASVPASGASRSGTPVRLFGTMEFKGSLSALPKWTRVVEVERRRPGLYLDRALGGKGGQQWRELRDAWSGLPLIEKLRKVNAFFNQWPYRLDSENYGVPDYWSTPDEFLKKSGDCEDYAIIKYFALKQLGVSPDSMRIVVLLDGIRGIAHAVLAVYVGDGAYILDNLSGLVLQHDFYKHYIPQYSVNESYRWAHIPLGKKAGRK